jgi:hypothetical protein
MGRSLPVITLQGLVFFLYVKKYEPCQKNKQNACVYLCQPGPASQARLFSLRKAAGLLQALVLR